LVDVSVRLGFLPAVAGEELRHRYGRVCAMLAALSRSMKQLD
jgi:hypothetical protein